MSGGQSWVALALEIPPAVYLVFFFGLLYHIAKHPRMFLKRFGRRHRLSGAAYLCWLIAGFVDVYTVVYFPPLIYDIILGGLGLTLTLTAAFDFKFHKNVKNKASGALDQDATITYDEMIEHSFYQGLNLMQASYLHCFCVDGVKSSLATRLLLLSLVTAPWLVRGWFPVNPFSGNYTRGQDPSSIVSILYRLKKYQYLLYKHVLLHGLNISVALSADNIAGEHYFRVYWLSLNAAYVLEFFLQTMVKRRYMTQQTMLVMNQMLMAVSTVAVYSLIQHVYLSVALASLVLNIVNRGNEITNVTMVSIATFSVSYWRGVTEI